MGEWTAERRAAAAERCRQRLEKHGHPMQGKKRSPAVKDKISKSLRNRFKDPKERERLSKQQIEVMKDPEVRARISRTARTTKKDPKYREKMSKLAKERMKNPEVREKMSESAKKAWDPARHAEYSERTRLQLERDGHPMKGKKHRPESIRKMSESHKAMTPETRRKISMSQKKRFEDPKEREKSSARATELMKDPARRKAAAATLLKHNPRKNTVPERCVQYILERLGVDYETHVTLYPDGKPVNADVFVEPNIVIEVDGDYWHARPGKFESGMRNRRSAHDVRMDNARQRSALARKGYRVIQIWASDVRDRTEFNVKRLAAACGVQTLEALMGRDYHWIASNVREYLDGLQKKRAKKWRKASSDRRNAHNRWRYETNHLGYRDRLNAANRARPKEQINAARRKKYQNDPEYRAQVNERNNSRYHNATSEEVEQRRADRRVEYQKNKPQIRAKQNTKYADDEAFRERQKARSRQRSKTHKDEISRKNKERHSSMTPDEKAKWSADRREYYVKNKDQIREQKKERRKNPEFLARERAQHKAYRENNSEKIKSHKAEVYKKKKLQNTATIVDELGGRCFKCGRESPDMLVGADMDAARADGHVHKRSTAWQYYVEKPAEAKKYLRLSCPNCKDWHGGMR